MSKKKKDLRKIKTPEIVQETVKPKPLKKRLKHFAKAAFKPSNIFKALIVIGTLALIVSSIVPYIL